MLKKKLSLRGLEGDKIIRIVHFEPVGTDSISFFYFDQEGKPGTQSLFRSDESRLELATADRPWSFEAPVNESMLPRQPLAYVLADDPGADKTIMAGLFIRELIMRADAKRILIVFPRFIDRTMAR